MTVARRIAPTIASTVQILERDGDRVVSVSRLEEIRLETGSAIPARQMAYRLQRAGWFGTLRTRDVWEFLPAARAGAIGAGDRFVEYRAQRILNPEWPGVLAMESAATLLGFARRLPDPEVVALPARWSLPKALAAEWRAVTLSLPPIAVNHRDGLSWWSPEGLLAGIAVRPTGYRDTQGLAEWLPEAAAGINRELLEEIIRPLTQMARQRVVYLLRCGGNELAAAELASRYPASQVAWFGPREPGGTFDPVSRVNDTRLSPYLSTGSIL